MLELICGFRGDKKLEVNDYWIVNPTDDKEFYAIMSDKGILGRYKTYENAKKIFKDMICEENLQINKKHRECKIKLSEIENGKEYVIVKNHEVFKGRVVAFIRYKDSVSGVRVLKDNGCDEEILFSDSPSFNTTYWRIEDGCKIYELFDNSTDMLFDVIKEKEE